MDRIDSFEAMLARGQDSEMLRYTLGGAYAARAGVGDRERAIVHLRAAVTMKPDYSAAWRALGRVLLDDGRPQEAIAAFDSGLAAVEATGDKQAGKEIAVFRRRAQKALDSDQDR